MKALWPPGMDPTQEPDFWSEYAAQIAGAGVDAGLRPCATGGSGSADLPVRRGRSSCTGGRPRPFVTGCRTALRMPVSTEQVLHPERWLAPGGRAGSLSFPSAPDVVYEDVLGESEVGVPCTARRRQRDQGQDAGGLGGDW